MQGVNLLKFNKIKRVRSYGGFKQFEMAKLMNLPLKKYNEMENLKRDFSIRDIIMFSKYLELNLDQVNEIFFNNELVR